MKKIFNLILTLFFINFIFASEIELTKEEKNFLKNNPTITIGIGSGWEPSAMLSKDGKITGYDADVLNEVNKATGANFVLKIGVWKDIQQEAKDKKIQGLSSVIQTPQREENFLFSDTFRVLDNNIVSKPSNLSLLKNKSDLKSQRIAIEKGNKLQQKIVDELEIQNVIYVDKIEETYEKVFQGQTDIAIGFGSLNYKLVKEGLPLLVDTGLYSHNIELKIAINKDIPQAYNILQKGLSSISEQTYEKLRNKWQLNIKNKKDSLNLTFQEKQYLKNNPIIKLGYPKVFKPLILENELGKIDGLYFDYYNLISKKLGIEIEYDIDTWDNTIKKLSDKKIDIIPTISKFLATKKDFLITEAPLKIYLEVYVNKKSNKKIQSLEDLKGLRVAYNKNIKVLDDYMQKNKDNYELVPENNTIDLLNDLQYSNVDAVVEFNRVRYLVSKNDLSDIVPSFRFNEIKIEAVTAVRNDSLLLQSIIQKAISSLSVDEIKSISEKWFGADSTNNKLFLTKEEEAYISNKKTLVMPTYEKFQPFNFIENDTPKGYLIDLSKLISDKLGLELKFVNGYVWKDHMQMLKDNNVDFIANMVKNDERQKVYNFSNKTTLSLLTGIVSKYNFSEIKDVENKIIGVEKKSIFEKFINENYPLQKVKFYDSKDDLITALINNDIDAFIDNYSVINYILNNTSLFEKNLYINLLEDDNLKNLNMYFSFNKDETILLNLFNKAYESIPYEEIENIKKKWGMKVSVAFPKYLSEEEIQYIKEKQSITVSNELDYEPIDYSINGIPMGYSIDLLELILKDTGLKINFKTDTWTNLFKEFKEGKIDLIHTLYKNDEREKFMKFSEGYLRGSHNFVQRSETKVFKNIKDLYGKKVGVTKGWYQETQLKKHPEIIRVYFDNIEEKLDALYNKKIDAFLNDKYVANYYIKKYGYTDLKVTNNVNSNDINRRSTAFHFATLLNEPHLISIVNKAYKNLSVIEQNKLLEKWFGTVDINKEDEITNDNNEIYFLAGLVLVLILSLFYIDSKRKSKNLIDSKEILEKILKQIDDNNNKVDIFKKNFKKYAYSLIVLGSFISISFVLFEYFISQNDKIGTVLNKAGKQRMLSQKLIIEANKVLNENYSDLYNKLILNLKNDHDWISANLSTDNEINYYRKNQVQEKVMEYIALNEKMIKNPSKELYKQIEKKGYLILETFEKAVLTHEKTYKDSIKLFEIIKLIETVIALICLYVLWLYVYKPNSLRQEALYDTILLEKDKILEVTKEQKNLLSLFDKGDAVLFKWKNNSTWDVEYVSDNVKNLFGYSKEEFLSKKIKYDSFIYEQDLDLTNNEVSKAIEENKDFFRHEPYRIVSRDGTIKWVLDVTVTQKDTEDNIIYFIGYIVDITEQKQLEEKLINNVNELESLNEDLQSKNEELSASEEELKAQQEELINNQHQIEMLGKAKEQFLANMSHEIRTPLNGIVGVVNMLIDEIGDNESAMYKLKTLKKSSNILTNVVNDILDYSSLQTGNMRLFHKEFSFRDMIKHIDDTIRDEIESKNLKFIVEIDDIIEDVLVGDELRLSQILLNLLSNAKKFTSSGKVLLKSKVLKVNKEHISLVIEVKDTGIGMNEHILDNLFIPFTQGSESNTKEFKGTGLGLSIVKKLIDLMNGKIEVYSYEKVGTTFKININLPYTNKKLIDTHKDEVLVLPKTKKALFVEDDTVNQFVIKGALNKRNIDVDILENGLEAVNRLKEEHSYDIIFMDVQMPVMDGHEATRNIREFNKDIPIIALSAGVLPENIQQSIDAGMNMHIVKPIINEEMNEVLNTYLMK